MARASLSTLLTRTRSLIGDPAGPTQTFSDDDLQPWLDSHQWVVRYGILRMEPTLQPSGTGVSYLDFYSESLGDWESDWQLTDSGYNVLTPTTADEVVGHWTFTTSQDWPVRIIGKSYDLFGAAADALEAWAAKVSLDFNFSTGGQSFNRSQKAVALRALAETYRRRAKPMNAQSVRSDTYGDTVGIYPYTGWFDY